MTQLQVDQAVARATGETLSTIHQRGFQLQAEPEDHMLEPEDLHLAVTCPFCGGSCALPAGPIDPDLLAECDPCDIDFDFDLNDVEAIGPEAKESPAPHSATDVAA